MDEILKRGKWVLLRYGRYICMYGDWTVYIMLTDGHQEYRIYYKGIYLDAEHTYDSEISIPDNVSLVDYIKGGLEDG